jgi:hypothetical protein
MRVLSRIAFASVGMDSEAIAEARAHAEEAVARAKRSTDTLEKGRWLVLAEAWLAYAAAIAREQPLPPKPPPVIRKDSV